MNKPEYILVDELGTKDSNGNLVSGLLYDVKQALGLSVLNYQYGYITELNETLKQWASSPDDNFSGKRYPLVWFAEPVDITRGIPGIYGRLDNGYLFIVNSTQKDWKAADRMTNNFKTILYPIYREILNQFILNSVFDHTDVEQIEHRVSNRYFWDNAELNDAVDTIRISGLKLRIANNTNYSILTNL